MSIDPTRKGASPTSAQSPQKIFVEVKFEEKKEIRQVLIKKLKLFVKMCSCILTTLGLLVTSVLKALNVNLSASLLVSTSPWTILKNYKNILGPCNLKHIFMQNVSSK